MAVYSCALRGTISSGSVGEIFSHSFGLESNAEPNVVVQAIHDNWSLAWNEGGTGLSNWFTPEIVYVEATSALVLDPLVPDLAAAYHSLFSPPEAGTAVGDTLPSQNALAISFRAGVRPNGTPFRGRSYMPSPAAQFIQTDGLLDANVQQGVLQQWTDFFNGLRTGGHIPSVWSRTVEDLVQPIQNIRVGNRVDTIRSRRNAQPESYVEAIIA